MKKLRRPIAILVGSMFFYLCGFWLYFHSDCVDFDFLGRTASLKLDRGLESFYSPCFKVEDAWRARRERQEEIIQFIGVWGSSYGGRLEIKKNGEFTMNFGEQVLQGIGRFEEIDGGLYFVAETTCQLDKNDEGSNRLIESFKYATPHPGRCRIEMNVFQADSEEDVLAAHVQINGLNGIDSEYLGFSSFVKAKANKP